MEVDEILEAYKNLEMRDRLIFDIRFNKIKREEEIKREEIAMLLRDNIVKENGEPYISSDWIKKNILKIID